METERELIEMMRAAAPPGQEGLRGQRCSQPPMARARLAVATTHESAPARSPRPWLRNLWSEQSPLLYPRRAYHS